MNRSVPPHLRAPSRPLTDDERRGLVRIADKLMPATGDAKAPSATPGYDAHLDRALAALDGALETLAATALRLAPLDDAALDGELRRLHAEEPERFQPLSAVVCGAYLTVPEVRVRIAYPGQERRPPAFDLAADEIMDGILDPVLERGHIHVPAPDVPSDRA